MTSNSRGVSVSSFARAAALGRGLAHFDRTRESAEDGSEQFFVIDRFGEEINRAGLHRVGACGDIAVAGEEDNLYFATGERLLKFQSIDAGHPQVEDEAGRAIVRCALKIGASRRECLRGQSRGPEKARKAPPNRLIVVHDKRKRARRRSRQRGTRRLRYH